MQFQFYSETHLPAVNRAVGDFVSERIWGKPGRFGPFCSMAIVDDAKLVAGVVYHNWQDDEGTVEISCGAATRRWMTRDVIRAAISMPFDRLGCQAIIARHSEEAKHIRHIWRSLGAVEYVVPRLRGRDAPAEAISVLTQEAWAASKWARQMEAVA